ncbi:MAG: ATP:cob(I)alamin adenosyltransferase [Desulfurococcales archaeon ex4484_42]|nr:MAG: ATP:cob(I)alamin adenosyltransferase [Desulfurococcales archaeon ex4484_42]
MPIYTKQGDNGKSYIPAFKGVKVPKSHIVFEVIGTIDELNSFIGLAKSKLRQYKELVKLCEELRRVQINLFKIGALIAKAKTISECIDESESKWIEAKIDHYSSTISTDKFVLPGGHEVASILHIARTVCRRLERRIVALSEDIPSLVCSGIIKYINRLSDYLYILALYVNKVLGVKEEEVKVEF